MHTVHLVPIDTVLIQAAVEVATDLQLRAGDAIYVALAHQLNIPLVSWDREQLQRAESLVSTYTPDNYTFQEIHEEE
jgi:predicted nucleic acid-binding protein